MNNKKSLRSQLSFFLKANVVMKVITVCLIMVSMHISHDLYAGNGSKPGWVDITIDTLKNIMVIAVAVITFIPGLFSFKEKKLAIKREMLVIKEKELLIKKLEKELNGNASK